MEPSLAGLVSPHKTNAEAACWFFKMRPVVYRALALKHTVPPPFPTKRSNRTVCAPSHGHNKQSRVGTGTGRGRAAGVKERQCGSRVPFSERGVETRAKWRAPGSDARQVSRGRAETRGGLGPRGDLQYMHLDQISRAWVVPIVASAMPVVPYSRLQGRTWRLSEGRHDDDDRQQATKQASNQRATKLSNQAKPSRTAQPASMSAPLLCCPALASFCLAALLQRQEWELAWRLGLEALGEATCTSTSHTANPGGSRRDTAALHRPTCRSRLRDRCPAAACHD